MSERTELKYFLSPEQKQRLLSIWAPFICPAEHTDANAEYPILSLYYDSPERVFYEEKNSGDPIRNKVRMRTYGTSFQAGQPVFLEIKHKIFEKVQKFRWMMPDFSRATLEPENWPDEDSREAQFLLMLRDSYKLTPAVQTFYIRSAWMSPQWPTLRITFDSMLAALPPGYGYGDEFVLQNHLYALPETQLILEIKSSLPIPHWVFDTIESVELERSSISKYVLCFDRLQPPEAM